MHSKNRRKRLDNATVLARPVFKLDFSEKQQFRLLLLLTFGIQVGAALNDLFLIFDVEMSKSKPISRLYDVLFVGYTLLKFS